MYQHDDRSPHTVPIAGPTGLSTTSVQWAELDYRYQVEAYKNARAAAKFDDARCAGDHGNQPCGVRPGIGKDKELCR
jgi:hypothetical protein